jgi:hypothetical protein
MIEPIDRQEQIDKTEPHDATEPTDRIDPTDPTDNTEPLEPIDRTESSDHSDHLELLSTPRTESMLNAPHGAGFGAYLLSLVHIDREVFGREVFVDPLGPAFAAEAGLFDAAEGCRRV